MGRKAVFVGFLVVLLVVGIWFVYQKMTDETYLGMSIIPEQHEDIPLYKGLEPTRTHYVIEGDHWEDIYNFYFKQLPKIGWKKEYSGSVLDRKILGAQTPSRIYDLGGDSPSFYASGWLCSSIYCLIISTVAPPVLIIQ